jgi:hypothetical protein
MRERTAVPEYGVVNLDHRREGMRSSDPPNGEQDADEAAENEQAPPSSAEQAKEKERQMEESGQENPG